MANRRFNQFALSLEKNVVSLFAKVAIGSTGACTLSAANSKGIASIVRNSTGNYTLTLSDVYVKLLGFHCQQLLASGLPAARDVCIASQAVATAAAPTIIFTTSTGGSATDPDSGVTMYIEIRLSNSTAF